MLLSFHLKTSHKVFNNIRNLLLPIRYKYGLLTELYIFTDYLQIFYGLLTELYIFTDYLQIIYRLLTDFYKNYLLTATKIKDCYKVSIKSGFL